MSARPVPLSKPYMTHTAVCHARHVVDSWWRTERIDLLVRGQGWNVKQKWSGNGIWIYPD